MRPHHKHSSTLSITSGLFRGRKLVTPVVPSSRSSDSSSVSSSSRSSDGSSMSHRSHSLITHPMGSREKLALFNTLESLRGPLTPATKILDLYCGSGALGLEALSRGAGTAVFVDQNPAAIKATHQNIAALGLKNRATVLRAKLPTPVIASSTPVAASSTPVIASSTPVAASSTPVAASPNPVSERLAHQQFDLILVDPPYDAFPAPAALSPLAGLLAPNGFLVLSHPASTNPASVNPASTNPASVNPASLFPNLRLLRTKSYAAANLSFFTAKL